jgi:hypothetical protein
MAVVKIVLLAPLRSGAAHIVIFWSVNRAVTAPTRVQDFQHGRAYFRKHRVKFQISSERPRAHVSSQSQRRT